MRRFVSLLLFTFLLFTVQESKGSHAAGLEITYSPAPGQPGCYVVTVKFYRDCIGIAAPASMFLNVSSASCGQNLSATANQVSCVEISPICPGYPTECDLNPPPPPAITYPGIEECIYEALVCLPVECDDWIISTSECCRNAAITNILNPGSDNIYVETLINNTQPYTDNNHSAVFDFPPVSFICDGQEFCYNNGATDADGDSLAYNLITPLTGPGTTVTYNAPMSNLNPFDGTTVFDPATGNICITPTAGMQQVTVLAIQVQEWRDDANGIPQLIGIITRDIQIQVLPCPGNDIPILSGIDGSFPPPLNIDTAICPGTVLDLNIFGSDANATDMLNLTEVGNNMPGSNFIITGNGTTSPVGNLTWTPTAADMNTTPYTLTVSVADDACPIISTYTLSYSILVTPDVAVLPAFTDICESEPPFTLSQGIPSGGTYTGTGVVNGIFDPSLAGPGAHAITYEFTNNIGCTGNDTKIINIEAMPDAGDNADITLCNDAASFNMFDLLGGTPQSTGLWTDINNNPANNIFNPNNQFSSIFTYTINGAVCPSDNSTVDVTIDQVPNSVVGNDTIICGDSFQMNAIASIGNGTWNVSSTNIDILDLTSSNSTVIANDYGVYTFTWTENNNNCVNSDDITIEFVEPPFQITINPQYTELCPDETVTLSINSAFDSYQWYRDNIKLTNSNFPNYTTGDEGQYRIEVTNSICTAISPPATVIELDLLDPTILTRPDSIICPVDPPFLLETQTAGGTWKGNGMSQNGFFTPGNAMIGENMVYYSLDYNCNEIDSIMIELDCPLQIFMPNVFTPNNDEHNDLLLIFGQNILDFEISIYNRWGSQIFNSKNIDFSNLDNEEVLNAIAPNHAGSASLEQTKARLITYWDGKFEGESVPVGVYSYTISAFGKDGQVANKTGTFSVLK